MQQPLQSPLHAPLRPSFRRLKLAGLCLALCIVVTITGMIAILPWWSFIIPMIAAGVLIEQVMGPKPGFVIGFAAGFAAWFLAALYYYYSLHTSLLGRIGALVGVPNIAVILVPGIVAGLLSGLALYTGQSIRRGIKTSNTTLN